MQRALWLPSNHDSSVALRSTCAAATLSSHRWKAARPQIVRGEIDPLLAVPWTALSMSMQSEPHHGPDPA
jgi:hypothetical protein